MTDDLRYPIGPEPPSRPLSPDARQFAIADIAALPVRIRNAVDGLDDPRLDTAYRPAGWTVRQLVHHVADSHLNAYLRMKLALTAEAPRIAPYDERAWAELGDSRLPVAVSLQLLDALHARWTALYASLRDGELVARGYFHPEKSEIVTLEAQLQTYSWHSRHHVAHITRLREREGW